jgi:hypothetical protein
MRQAAEMAFIKAAKRLFDEINYAQQRGDYQAEAGFKPWLFQIRKVALRLYPDNIVLTDLVGDLDPSGYFNNPRSASANLTTIKMQLLQIIDAVGLDFEEISKIPTLTPLVNINQTQSNLQINYQSIESLISNLSSVSPHVDNKMQVVQLLTEFDNECKSTKPDKSRLRSILSRIGPLSTQVGLIVLKYAIDHGLLSWMDLK